jgi:uncharacterized protein (DUF362 family)
MTDHPFNPNPQSPAVHVTHGPDAYANTISVLEVFDLSAVDGKTVLLKPNAGRMAEFGTGVNTNPLVVAAAIDAFRAAGASVAVGESPITGVKTLEALEVSGIAAVAKERSCPLIDLDRRSPVETAIPDGKAIQSLKVCAEVLEYDFIVSIPVMKIHMHTGVTLAVKNMKGCLWRRSKVELHMLPQLEGAPYKSLDIAIGDMAMVLRPDFSIIDGSVCMEGLGPGVGTPKELNVVVAGGDAFAADAVSCRLMGRDAAGIPHLHVGAENGCGVIDLDRIKVTPENWQEWASDFEAAPENLSFEFPNVEVFDNNSCSACQSTLLLFLERYGENLADYIPPNERLRIAIGKGHENLPEGTFCIGQCTAKQKGDGMFAPGCPPVGSQIYKILKQNGKPEEAKE